ncbi:hypothetical protein SDC9_107463 [bioreactor metagenome]|uniref:Uncharacterized protein n=1 Tax=bioreactor metagenome TaxID=1076179 RepID=A0A645B7M6_9ZZZZ
MFCIEHDARSTGIVVYAVYPFREVAFLDHILQHLSGLHKDLIGEFDFAINGSLENVRSTESHREQYKVLCTGPLGLVGQSKGDDAVLLEGFSYLHKLTIGLGRSQIVLFEEILVVVHDGGGVHVRRAVYLSIIHVQGECTFTYLVLPSFARLCDVGNHTCINKGFQPTATPRMEYVREVVSGHRLELGFVRVGFDDRDVHFHPGVSSFKSSYCVLNRPFCSLIYLDVPQLKGRSRFCCCFSSSSSVQTECDGYHKQQGNHHSLLHSFLLLEISEQARLFTRCFQLHMRRCCIRNMDGMHNLKHMPGQIPICPMAFTK